MRLQEALRIIAEICATPAVAGNPADMAAGRLTDAHAYTSTLIRNDFPRLLAIDEEFIKSAATGGIANFEHLILQITEYATTHNYKEMAQLNDILQRIRAFVDSPQRGLESAETNINVSDLLLRCWSLALAHNEHYILSGGLTQILECLSGNIIDAGGCIPGVIARLYPAYARLLQAEMQFIEQAPAAGLFYLRATVEEDDELLAALAESRADTTAAATKVQEDEDLQLALALSRSLG